MLIVMARTGKRIVSGKRVDLAHDCKYGGYRLLGSGWDTFELSSSEMDKMVRKHTFTCALAKKRWHCKLRT